MLPATLPFYFKAHCEKGNGGYAESLPFNIYFDDKLKIYRQRTSDALNAILRNVYESGSLVEGSLSNESGKIYLDKLVNYIDEMAGIENKSILELGCGSGLLLKELNKKNASVLGVEPGAHQLPDDIGDIRIIRDFFPTPHITGHFDVIVHYGVMEHIGNPGDFLVQQQKFLRQGGKIVISVPNSEPFLEKGDISIFIHEHFNYFTREGMKNVVDAAGLFLQDISLFEGVILATASVNPADELKNIGVSRFSKETFESRISSLNKKVEYIFTKYKEEDVAVYVPFRGMNALFLANKLNSRLVDDNSQVRGKYLPCFSKQVEDFDSLRKNPPGCILIYSRTFGDRIKEKCIKERSLQSTEILTLNDLD